ncbi:hypothetical protein IFR05_010429 [Cadophora sp. M221]|nr:hypothetical protein IFR05_010429 [Cadophora sp. M221]
MGMVIAAEAGFDPQCVIDWLNGIRLISEPRPEADDDHPTTLNRISALRPFLDEVREKIRRSAVDVDLVEALEFRWQNAYNFMWMTIQNDTDNHQEDDYIPPETSITQHMGRVIGRDFYPRLLAIGASLNEKQEPPLDGSSRYQLEIDIAAAQADGDRVALAQVLYTLSSQLAWAERSLGLVVRHYKGFIRTTDEVKMGIVEEVGFIERCIDGDGEGGGKGERVL